MVTETVDVVTETKLDHDKEYFSEELRELAKKVKRRSSKPTERQAMAWAMRLLADVGHLTD